MTSLKEHQAAMVSMLASGTAIPTSAIRLAHALHDVLAYMNDTNAAPVAHTERRIDATTSGLNDVLLAYDIAAVKPACKHTWEDTGRELKCKDCGAHPSDMAAVKPKRSGAEQQIAMLNNTIRQLRESNMKLRGERDYFKASYEDAFKQIESMPEQAGCRKEDTQCYHIPIKGADGGTYCDNCGVEL